MTIAATICVLVSVCVCLARVVVAKDTMTRIVAADTIGVMMIVVLALVGALLNAPYILDIALVFSVLLFVDLIVLAKYFEKRMLHK